MSLVDNASLIQRDGDEDEIEKWTVPDLTVKDLLSVIPAHCWERSTLRSASYVVWDFFLLGLFLTATLHAEPYIAPAYIGFPHPALYSLARFSLWSIYGFGAGLVGTGLWIIAHECGHGAFSKSRTINHVVGWFLHSGLGVPYHSWRITHAKHHAYNGHLTLDQVFVPRTRSEHSASLPAFDSAREDLDGTPSKVQKALQEELREALHDAPLVAMAYCAVVLLFGWPWYLLANVSGQRKHKGASHFSPKAPFFAPTQSNQILISDFGIIIWLGALISWAYLRGASEMIKIYLVPYLWVNHWIVLITFLQHTDPIVPHYRASSFTFPRGALSTLDRNLLGGDGFFGKITGWIGATTTHGISETHVAHHVASKIPHYHAWEASAALKVRLASAGYSFEGRPGTWGEIYRVWNACKFVEDEGDVVFYKDARGIARRAAVFSDNNVSDSGVELQ
ncbi:hypothetical protein BOTBODRAFT_139354 [Botryobasidium botryosum FD-172 SS1]|uniref:Fatty acid desaturase domain-containing protein n=1 Tax=Botryobasidium botryosum (strain FD-172 SS1) TaxID=930990 RepID=A0A067LXC8_BOTB1|nr:hypothetical protein BOTBODRAFT_139354 [Botryobasidium botryosum FD-172 SS1]